MNDNNEILILALGNDIMGDDGVSLLVARELKKFYDGRVEIEEIFGGGLELLDFITGRKKVLLIDSITTGKAIPGTIFELTEKEFQKIEAVSPHYIGLPEVVKMAGLLEIDFPDELKIIAVETYPQFQVVEGLSPEVRDAIPEMYLRAQNIIEQWLK